MTSKAAYALVTIVLLSCNASTKKAVSTSSELPLVGTWQLLQATLIEKGDTTITNYSSNISFINVINETHFAFLQHDLKKGKDSAALFVAGGGRYTLKDSLYTEQLEYCSAREWEGHDFPFTLTLNADTLTQFGREVVAAAGVDRINIERYVRVKQ